MKSRRLVGAKVLRTLNLIVSAAKTVTVLGELAINRVASLGRVE